MKKKTIAFVIPSLSSGGAERVVSTLSNELVKDYDIVIINFVANTPFYKLNEAVKIISCRQEFKPSKNTWQALKLNYGLYRKIAAIFKAEKIDIGIGFMTTANVMAILAAKANKIPVIISERIDPNHSETPAIWRQIKKYIYPKSDYLIVQTEQIKKFFTSIMSEKKLVILPNPLSNELSQNKSSEGQRKNIVLNVGRLTDQKGQDILIRAFAELNPNRWKLIIVGEGPKREAYQDLIRNLNMEEKILLVGQTKDISEYYNMAKIFAFTSHFEGFPNALIEAMYMGLACISTDCPTGPSELIVDGENGFLIEVNDKQTLKNNLHILIHNDELRHKMSKVARKNVLKFEVNNVVNAWEKTISSAMSDNVFR